MSASALRAFQLFPKSAQEIVLKRHDEIQTEAPEQFEDEPERIPKAVAKSWFNEICQDLYEARLHHAYDESQIRDFAENRARLCVSMTTEERRIEFLNACGVEPPAGRMMTDRGRYLRTTDSRWWRRQLRKSWTRASENALREIGAIRKGRQPYASDEAVKHRADRKQRMREFLESHEMVCSTGETLPLLKLAEKSIANPRIRRGEFMTRVRGFEEIAEDVGHTWTFATLTTPSCFHAQLSKGGRNPAHDRERVRDGQAWLRKQWGKCRAKLSRLSVRVYGFRAAEPHHDATPHWHMLIFGTATDVQIFKTVARGMWLSEYGDEKGAAEVRVSFKDYIPGKGSAAGYLAKYISKNIDGHGTIGAAEDNETARPISEGVERVDAWASVHGIRQFQQIGGPPVGLWREARRLRDPVEDANIERARSAADAGDWCEFWKQICDGDITKKRILWIERDDAPFTIRPLNHYGEEKQPRIIGLRYCSTVQVTRPHTWKIEKCTGTVASSSAPGSWKTGNSTDFDGIQIKPEMLGGGHGIAYSSELREAVAALPLGEGMEPRAARRESDRVWLSVLSDLGPVAITVRGASGLNEPTGWTNSNETSMYGPENE